MNDLEIDLLALDLLQRSGQRFERTLRIALQHNPQMLLSVGRFEQAFEGGALGRAQLVGAPPSTTLSRVAGWGPLNFSPPGSTSRSSLKVFAERSDSITKNSSPACG